MFARGDGLSQGQQMTFDDTITEYRKHLHDVSWLMHNLNEYIPVLWKSVLLFFEVLTMGGVVNIYVFVLYFIWNVTSFLLFKQI